MITVLVVSAVYILGLLLTASAVSLLHRWAHRGKPQGSELTAPVIFVFAWPLVLALFLFIGLISVLMGMVSAILGGDGQKE